jgi:putative membrane protein
MSAPVTAPPTRFTVKRFLQTWIINSLAVALAAWLLRGIDYDRPADLLLAALLLGVLNAFVRPLLLTLALPLLVLTLGLFLFVVNALLLWLVSALVSGFRVESFGWALAGAVIIGFVSLVLHVLTGLNRARIQVRRGPPPPPRRPDDNGPVIDV